MHPRKILLGDNRRRGSIAQTGRITSRDGTTLLEDGHEFSQRIHGGIAANRLIRIYYYNTLLLLDLYRNDLILEATSSRSRRCLRR